MSLHPLVAAKFICQLRNWRVTNLELNKILYVANMVFLGRNGGVEPLVDEYFQAWDYGPVLPSVYHRAKAFGNKPVRNVLKAFPDLDEAGDEAKVIKETVGMLARKTPGQLVAITHWGKGAWAKYYQPGSSGVIIPNEDILQEYRDRVG